MQWKLDVAQLKPYFIKKIFFCKYSINLENISLVKV